MKRPRTIAIVRLGLIPKIRLSVVLEGRYLGYKTILLITIFSGFLGSVNDFTIQSSKLRDIEENAFDGTHQRLHTLSIHNF